MSYLKVLNATLNTANFNIFSSLYLNTIYQKPNQLDFYSFIPITFLCISKRI